MPIKVVITNDFAHLSKIAADIVKEKIVELFKKRKEIVLGLATGNSPTGMYKHLAQAANNGEFDSARIRSFNLDEYVGLPGENVQQRLMHPESYCYFMIQELFGLLKRKFIETNVPFGSLIDQKTLIKELRRYPGDWTYRGTDAGKSIAIKQKTGSQYLAWVRKEILGHLIDSAVNNHQRFVRAQIASPLVGPGYDQEAWVSLHRYRERPWADLVVLWAALNGHLAAVIEAVPAEKRQTPCIVGDRPAARSNGGCTTIFAT